MSCAARRGKSHSGAARAARAHAAHPVSRARFAIEPSLAAQTMCRTCRKASRSTPSAEMTEVGSRLPAIMPVQQTKRPALGWACCALVSEDPSAYDLNEMNSRASRTSNSLEHAGGRRAFAQFVLHVQACLRTTKMALHDPSALKECHPCAGGEIGLSLRSTPREYRTVRLAQVRATT